MLEGSESAGSIENKGETDLTVIGSNNDDSEEVKESMAAKRALRTASYLSIFFLITTDILGKLSSPGAQIEIDFLFFAAMLIGS